MNRSSRRSLTILFVALLVIVNVVAMRWSTAYFFPSDRSALLQYGSQMPHLSGQNLIGNKAVEIPTGRTNLVLYFSSTRQPGLSIELIKYAEILFQHYGKKGFGVSAIVQPDVEELKSLIEHSLLSYDLIVDQDRRLSESLGLASNENGVFLFDREGNCRFATRGPVRAKDLQQLVAVEVLGVDPYSYSSVGQRFIEQGRQLGSWSLLDARSWKQTSLDKVSAGDGRQFVFFTADCSVCSLPGYLEEFGKFEQSQLRESGNNSSSVLVFDYNFSITEVLNQLKTHNINAPAYIANEELPSVSDLMQGGERDDETVVAVKTDRNGVVLDISPLKSFIARVNISNGSDRRVNLDLASKEARYEEVFTNIPLTAYDVAAYREKYILTDFTGNRIFIVNQEMQVERQFGKIGSGPGRLFRPGSVDVSQDGTIYVEDGGNERIVKFDQAGNYLGELRLGSYEGFAVSASNELYLGQPEEGHVITVYSSDGKKLRSFGRLKTFSEVNGPAFAEKDLPFKFAINRVRLAADSAGNIYASFTFTPLLQKYSSDGRLLFETRLEGREIEDLKVAIQKRKYITSPVEGPADGRIIAVDPVIDPSTGNILVPLVDGSIYVADGAGKRIDLLRPRTSQPADQRFYPFVAGLGAKGEFLVNPFPPKRWYRLTIPPPSDGKAANRSANNHSDARL